MTNPVTLKADYGLDAPGVVRNLFIVAAAGFALWLSARLGLWSGILSFQVGSEPVNIGISQTGIGFGIGSALTGLWMIWESKVGKIKGREELLDNVSWTGAEQVLDLGCGRGLLLIGAAKRLTTGKATGIDIWQSEDLSDNRPDATLENAKREGVQDRVELRTADMRELPFADNSFDVILSRAAIHNLYNAEDRAKAIKEVARVLKPGGHAVIEDIRHGNEYRATFVQYGCTDIKSFGSMFATWVATLITLGTLRPVTLLVTKSK